jgi:hypothetical protein
MTQEQIEHFENLIAKAVQSGKRETSGLVDEIMHRMEAKLEIEIEKSINKNVNGKIIRLTDKLDAHMAEESARWDEYSPYIKGLANVGGVTKLIVFLAVAFTTVMGAFYFIHDHLVK